VKGIAVDASPMSNGLHLSVRSICLRKPPPTKFARYADKYKSQVQMNRQFIETAIAGGEPRAVASLITRFLVNYSNANKSTRITLLSMLRLKGIVERMSISLWSCL
jgi:hypothetical protein